MVPQYSEIEEHKASFRQLSDIRPTENEIEEGKTLLEELIQRERGASEASAHVNASFCNEISIHRPNFLDDAAAYCENDYFK